MYILNFVLRCNISVCYLKRSPPQPPFPPLIYPLPVTRVLYPRSSFHLQFTISDINQLSTIHNTILDILTLSTTFTQSYLNLKSEILSPSNPRKRHLRTSSLSSDEETPTVPSQESHGKTNISQESRPKTDISEIGTKSPFLETLTEREFLDFVRHLDDRFIRAVPFIRSGLKGSVRAVEFASLGILAGSLEAGVR